VVVLKSEIDLLLTRSFYFFIVILFIGGCSSKEMDYTYNSYHRGGGLSSSSGSGSYKYVHPRDEKIKDSVAMHRATMRSYEVAGVTYHPYFVNTGDTYVAIASWYGPNFHERKTSNGETYNMYAYTAAHKTFPMNTIVKVTNLENSKEVIVRINDRGPFVHGRIIDLSNAAAHKIDMVKKGTAKVKLEVLSLSSTLKKLGSTSNSSYKTYKTNQSPKQQIKRKKYLDESDYEIYVQLGAFSHKNGAITLRDGFVSDKYKTKIDEVVIDSKIIYKVLVYEFESEKEARDFIDESGIDGLHIVRKLK